MFSVHERGSRLSRASKSWLSRPFPPDPALVNVRQRFCADMMIDHMYLRCPRATIVFDPNTQLLRLILLDSSLSTAVTFESKSGLIVPPKQTEPNT